MPPSKRRRTDSSSRLGALRSSRRRALHLGAVALAGSVAGCFSGVLDDANDETTAASGPETTTEPTDESPTTHALGVDTSLPEGSVEFPEGPKSRPERPADLTPESVRTYVETFEGRWVYNDLYRGESSSVSQECGVDSVTEYGEGFQAIAWCSAWANSGKGETTIHADYFTQYATYLIGPDSTVRREGKPGTRR
ncbi:hypothetical protein [Halorussus pelagicus]|uniref:hypothetical protein n=1 Tax=Halorussus pelagicus TaxID=2505977 RepID=UPI000FFC1795|nr:hypothetical protein [Halorussus pelagicus]